MQLPWFIQPFCVQSVSVLPSNQVVPDVFSLICLPYDENPERTQFNKKIQKSAKTDCLYNIFWHWQCLANITWYFRICFRFKFRERDVFYIYCNQRMHSFCVFVYIIFVCLHNIINNMRRENICWAVTWYNCYNNIWI